MNAAKVERKKFKYEQKFDMRCSKKRTKGRLVSIEREALRHLICVQSKLFHCAGARPYVDFDCISFDSNGARWSCNRSRTGWSFAGALPSQVSRVDQREMRLSDSLHRSLVKQ